MDREILFRGFYESKDGTKRIRINGKPIKGEWAFWDVFGKLTNFEGAPKIYIMWATDDVLCHFNKVGQLPICEETVGQYTGKTDMHGNKIFEGDNVLYDVDEIGIIEWDKQTAKFSISTYDVIYDFDNFRGDELEIMGNIFEGLL